MKGEPKVGMVFEHSRLIIGSPKATARPDRCQVTRVTRDTVYYHNESGFKLKIARDRFAGVVGKEVLP